METQLAEVQARLANYEAMWRLWDEEGILPPRTCELREALENGGSIDDLIAEIEAASRSVSQLEEGR